MNQVQDPPITAESSRNEERRSARAGVNVESPWLWLSAAALLGVVCIRHVLTVAEGVPSVPLDDAYIHFQYARAILSGAPLTYTPGSAPAAGATSLLWPLLLAPFQALGFRDSAIIWIAWLFGYAALGLLARETYLLANKLVSQSCAVAAGLATFAFAANAWFASSGMEVVPLAWLLARSTRRAAEWAEGKDVSVWELMALAWCAAAMRPEGGLATLMVAATLAAFPRERGRVWAGVALLGCGLVPLINFILTGQIAQTTSRVKWLPFSPYYDAATLTDAIVENVRLFVTTLLNGELWSSAFIPEGSRVIALLLLPAVVLQGVRSGRSVRTLLIVILGLGMLIPTTYDSFLWNRLRYLWPFSAAWLIGIAALSEIFGAAAALVRPPLLLVRTSLAFGCVAMLATKLPFAIHDLALSSDAITKQQVSLGRWAREALPKDALLGVNDTGAIAYFSERRVFDVVGLTTRGEAKYWVMGAGSRFEHYERLGAKHLPTHLLVYPEWFGIPWLLSPCLTERAVYGRTILGGVRMLACVADYSALGSGSLPILMARAEKPIDSVDVCDLESEAAHGYVVLPARQHENVAIAGFNAIDGARLNRTLEHFEIMLRPGGSLVLRLGAEHMVRVRVSAGSRALAELSLTQSWQEHEIAVPNDLAAGRYPLTLTSIDGAPFTAFHYWSYAEH